MGEIIDLERERRARQQARQRRDKALREAGEAERRPAGKPAAGSEPDGPGAPPQPGEPSPSPGKGGSGRR